MKYNPIKSGTIVATPSALELLTERGFHTNDFLGRHLHGDWGDLDPDDVQANVVAVRDGLRVMSVYRLINAEHFSALTREQRRDTPTIWIITEHDRSVTTLLLPEEY